MSQTTISSEFTNSTMDRLASMAHETIDRVTPPKGNPAEQEVRDAAMKAASSATALPENAAEAVEDNLRKARSYAESNLLITAGIAFATGALLGAVLRR